MNIKEMLKEMDKAFNDDNTKKYYRYSGIILESLRKRTGDDFLAAMVEAGPERVVVLPCKVGDTVYGDGGKPIKVDTFLISEFGHVWVGAYESFNGVTEYNPAPGQWNSYYLTSAAALKGDK